VIDGESDFKEIHEVSLGDDTLNKVSFNQYAILYIYIYIYHLNNNKDKTLSC